MATTINYPCASLTTYPTMLIQPRDATSTLTTTASPTSTSIPLTNAQILHDEFWPYGGGVLIAFGACVLIYSAIWKLDKTYEAKEFGLNLLVWIWGTWWTIVFWPFQMLGRFNGVLNRGLGRDRDGRPRVPREMEEC